MNHGMGYIYDERTWIALFVNGVTHIALDWVFGYLLRVSFRLEQPNGQGRGRESQATR